MRQTRETSVRAHYVSYKKVEDQWLRMDDAAVQKVNLAQDYNINLLFYRKANVPIQPWNIYLDFLPLWQPRPSISNCEPGLKVNQNGLNVYSNKKKGFGNFSQALPNRPPLITHQELSPKKAPAPNPLQPENPSRIQPKRTPMPGVILPDTDSESNSWSSVASPISDREDQDYIPPKNKGTLLCRNFLSEYLVH